MNTARSTGARAGRQRMLGSFLKPYRAWYGAIALVMVVALCFESLSLVGFFPVFQALLDPAGAGARQGVIGHLLVQWTRLVPVQDPVLAAATALAALMVCKTALILWRESLIAHTSARVLRDLQNAVLVRYAKTPPKDLVDQKHGDVLFECLIAPGGVALLIRRWPQLVAELLRVLAITVVLLFLSTAMTLVLLLVVAGVMGLTHVCSKRMAYNSGKGRVDASADQMSLVNELLDGHRQLVVYGVLDQWLKRFQELSHRYARLLARYLVWLAIPRAVIELAIVLIVLGLIGMIRLLAPAQLTASLPTLALFAVALFQLLPSLSTVGRLRMELEEALPNAERLHGVLTAPSVEARGGRRCYQRLTEAVVFDAVSFQYPGRPPLLSTLTLTLRRGTVTALLGPSGVGKTTLVSLLLGLLEPSEGRILVDGIPLHRYDLQTWRAQLGYVSQEAFIFHATVEENIRFGRRGYSHADVVAASMVAHAHSFINELPQRYETVMGEHGAKLSGGQQQRIAIARAILGNPDLLILDEATSALDHASERVVQQAMAQACRDRTVLMVTHGMGMAMDADHIVVLEGGRIVQERAKTSGQPAETLTTLLTRSYGQP